MFRKCCFDRGKRPKIPAVEQREVITVEHDHRVNRVGIIAPFGNDAQDNKFTHILTNKVISIFEHGHAHLQTQQRSSQRLLSSSARSKR